MIAAHRNKIKNSTSKFRGVTWAKYNRKWRSYVNINCKRINLGYFLDEKHAAEIYDNYVISNKLNKRTNLKHNPYLIELERLEGNKLYKVFKAMKDRCNNLNNKDYKHYGGRGITICKEWLNDSRAFLKWATENGYLKGLSIDRRDNDKGYSPENCRWVTQNTQVQNRGLLSKNNTSGYRGITQRRDNRWQVRIGINGVRVHLGIFSEKRDAALAYDRFVIENKLEHPTNILKKDY